MELSGGVHLLGVVFQGGKGLALLGKGEETFQVGVGDDINGLYRVDSIDQDEVYLTEKSTGNTLKLHIYDPGVKP